MTHNPTAIHLRAVMHAEGITVRELARRMKTSTSQVVRLRDPNHRVMLTTIERAFNECGWYLVIHSCPKRGK